MVKKGDEDYKGKAFSYSIAFILVYLGIRALAVYQHFNKTGRIGFGLTFIGFFVDYNSLLFTFNLLAIVLFLICVYNFSWAKKEKRKTIILGFISFFIVHYILTLFFILDEPFGFLYILYGFVFLMIVLILLLMITKFYVQISKIGLAMKNLVFPFFSLLSIIVYSGYINATQDGWRFFLDNIWGLVNEGFFRFIAFFTPVLLLILSLINFYFNKKGYDDDMKKRIMMIISLFLSMIIIGLFFFLENYRKLIFGFE
jgi:hypothetical protein